jgi:hypothetical protein
MRYPRSVHYADCEQGRRGHRPAAPISKEAIGVADIGIVKGEATCVATAAAIASRARRLLLPGFANRERLGLVGETGLFHSMPSAAGLWVSGMVAGRRTLAGPLDKEAKVVLPFSARTWEDDMVDRYTKAVLTIIAFALVLIAAQNMIGSPRAQPEEIKKVQLCGPTGDCANVIQGQCVYPSPHTPWQVIMEKAKYCSYSLSVTALASK